MSSSSGPQDAESTIRMTPDEERAAHDSAAADESQEPADEGIGVHSDADADSHTEN
jgi:hypothetical protein